MRLAALGLATTASLVGAGAAPAQAPAAPTATARPSYQAFLAAADRCGFPRAALETGTSAHPYPLRARDMPAYLCLMQAMQRGVAGGPVRIGLISEPAAPSARAPGGVELILQVDPASLPAEPIPREGQREVGIERARAVIVRRLAARGFAGAMVERQGADRLLVRVPDVRDVHTLMALVTRPARLEFRLVDASVPPEDLVSGHAQPQSEILPYPDGVRFGGPIAVFRQSLLTGDMIVDAVESTDETDGSPVVSIVFNDDGRRRFAEATAQNVGHPFAIILDGVIVSAPRIDEPILGGTAQIRGSFTVDSAGELAAVIASGALPVRLSVVEERSLPNERHAR